MKPIIGLARLKRKTWAIALSMISLANISGCQQAHIQFTDVQPPVIPSFTSLEGAPVPNSLSAIDHSENNRSNTSNVAIQSLVSHSGQVFTLHRFEPLNSGQTEIELIGVSPHAPIENINILATAFQQKSSELAVTNLALAEPNACIDGIQVEASLHYVSLRTHCHLSTSKIEQPTLIEVGSLFSQFWQPEAFSQLDVSQVQRQLKLNKHINAYSGQEIETAWRRVILGDPHPYNSILDNRALLETLELSSLIKLQQHIATQLEWHVFIKPSGHTPLQVTDIAQQIMKGLPISAEASKHVNEPANSELSQVTITANKGRQIIYLIDAPGAAQTQVRVGYGLRKKSLLSDANDNDRQPCKVLAALLGRNYSGRLFHDLREQRGLTYGIYGQCLSAPLSMTLKFQGNTQLKHTGAFISGILDHLDLVKETSMTTDELKAVQNYLLGQQRLATDSSQTYTHVYRQALAKGLHTQQVQLPTEYLYGLTPARLQQEAQALLDSTPIVVIRGDLDIIRADLQSKLQNWTIKVVSAN